MKVLFIHLDNIILCPPALNAVLILLDLGVDVTIMAYNVDEMDANIINNKYCKVYDLGRRVNPSNSIKKYYLRYNKRKQIRRYFDVNFNNYDVVWTTSEITVRELGETLLKCNRHIMQLMELVDYVPKFGSQQRLTFPIEKYAQHAEKVVVPEYNRAHIVKTRWHLDKLPVIMPNKPYNTKIDKLSDDANKMIDTIKKEKRRVLLYQGGFTRDRRFEEFAEAAKQMGKDYCMYIMGYKNEYCAEILDKYPNVVYLGALKPPEHLVIAQYAYIGILTYVPVKTSFYSELNALYCAPNKVYEYALYNLPMIGTDVPGLSEIFNKYGIGLCCEELSAKSIVDTIKKIELKHEEMKKKCKYFYNDTDLVNIMKGIIR